MGEYNARVGSDFIISFEKVYNTSKSSISAEENVNVFNWPSFNEQNTTYYAYNVASLSLTGYSQTYLDGRVSKMWNNNGATYFSYDAQGRVTFVVQYLNFEKGGQYFTIDYTYSPLTSQVQKISFQKNYSAERFEQLYMYDNDSRLSKTLVSRDGSKWYSAAEYNYYKHGPLRTELIGDKVQKTDYVYNINGWLKAINNPMNPNVDTDFAQDVFAEAINYYKGDYNRSATNLTASDANTPVAGSSLGNKAYDLFSGNISSTFTNMPFDKTDPKTPPVMAQTYRYDYLNRLKESYTETAEVKKGSFVFTPNTDNSYNMSLTYDANGNILNLNRNAYSRKGNTDMDQLLYKYATDIAGKKLNNRLLHVNDDANSTDNFGDIKDQGVYNAANRASWNYRYDPKGRMVYNRHDTIDSIVWTPYNKIEKIIPTVGSSKPTVSYTYNAMQQRLSKNVTQKNGNSEITYYIYDASGVLMANYKVTALGKGTGKDTDKPGKGTGKPAPTPSTNIITEHYMYGTKRLGSYKCEDEPNADANTNFASRQYFELTDHLGNLRAVVKGQTDKKGKTADVVTLTDYYPFGMTMPGRNYSAGAYRWGFNGKENEAELKGWQDYGFREVDNRLGRFMSTDPLRKSFPGLTPFQFAGNTPIVAIDLDGLEDVWTSYQVYRYTLSGTTAIQTNVWYDITNSGLRSSLQELTGTMPNSSGSYFTREYFDVTDGKVTLISYDVQYIGNAEVYGIRKTSIVENIAHLETIIHGNYNVKDKLDGGVAPLGPRLIASVLPPLALANLLKIWISKDHSNIYNENPTKKEIGVNASDVFLTILNETRHALPVLEIPSLIIDMTTTTYDYYEPKVTDGKPLEIENRNDINQGIYKQNLQVPYFIPINIVPPTATTEGPERRRYEWSSGY